MVRPCKRKAPRRAAHDACWECEAAVRALRSLARWARDVARHSYKAGADAGDVYEQGLVAGFRDVADKAAERADKLRQEGS